MMLGDWSLCSRQLYQVCGLVGCDGMLLIKWCDGEDTVRHFGSTETRTARMQVQCTTTLDQQRRGPHWNGATLDRLRRGNGVGRNGATLDRQLRGPNGGSYNVSPSTAFGLTVAGTEYATFARIRCCYCYSEPLVVIVRRGP